MHYMLRSLILALFCATAISSALSQESRVEPWKTVPAQAEPVAELPSAQQESKEVSQETQKVSEPPAKVEDPLADLKAQVSARAETIEERKERKRRLEAYEKSLSKNEKEALNQIRKEQKRSLQREKLQRETLQKAHLSGCPEGSVEVHWRAVGSTLFRQHFVTTVTNMSSVPVNIREEGIEIVRNLCPGGTIRLFKARRNGIDAQNIWLQYVAFGVSPEGRTLQAASRPLNINIWQVQWRMNHQEIWNICLQGNRCSN